MKSLSVFFFLRLHGYDYDGHEMKHLSNVTIEECEAACDREFSCVAYSFDVRECFLKDKIDKRILFVKLGTTGIKLTSPNYF